MSLLCILNYLNRCPFLTFRISVPEYQAVPSDRKTFGMTELLTETFRMTELIFHQSAALHHKFEPQTVFNL
ncbi:MAG: hypothetical protein DRI57_24660 [Deltaproteobacteria bacterium]|nr:MAG: hypothetical protein DRI57_24660 [Deltaproteobacteria bacterium]